MNKGRSSYVHSREGQILAEVQGKTIGVDPNFIISSDVISRKPGLFLFQDESDGFFEKKWLNKLGATINLAFVDGMHLFEYALRDILNTERYMANDGVIFAHDCFPRTAAMAQRELPTGPQLWAGDVWKIIPILQEYRPDLTLTSFDCPPTGLLAISGINPNQDDLLIGPQLDAIVEKYKHMTIEDFGVSKFFDLVPYSDAMQEVKDDFPLVAHLHREDLELPQSSFVTP